VVQCLLNFLASYIPGTAQAGGFQHFMEVAEDPMLVVDLEGRIVAANSQARKLFGYSAEELIGCEVEILMPERFRCRHPGRWRGFAADPLVRPMGAGRELFGQRKDGGEFSIGIALSPMQYNGRAMVFAGIRDISERKRAEQRFRSLLESAPDAIVVVNREGRILLVNAQAEKLFGTDGAGA
jgi:PAS domain S-box-containing protein